MRTTMKKEKLNKFIIAFDTICDGWQCATDEQGKPAPTLHNSEDEAMVELFDDALSMFESQTTAERRENGVEPKLYAEMKKVSKTGSGLAMKTFLDLHPECNYNNEFIVPAEEFVFGRKAIFTGTGVKITGKKL